MPKNLSFALIVGLATSFLAGCGFFVEDETETTVVVSPPPPPTSPAPAPPKSTGASVLGNLAPPTNPQARVQVLTKEQEVGRPDPFAPVSPVGRPGRLNSDQTTLPRPGEFRSTQQISQRVNQLRLQAQTRARLQAQARLNPGLFGPDGTPLATLDPKDARGVILFGVAAVSGIPQAIIRAPGESVTRTVRIGDLLANGVRVKNILAFGPNPVIVLEQYGQQVTVAVGQTQAAAPGAPGQPPAM